MSNESEPDSFDGQVLFDHLRRQGRFEPIRMIGSGGMADVVLARDTRLKKLRALKFIKSEYMRKPEILDRFLNEAPAMCAIEHPNVLRVYDIVDIKDDEGKALFHYHVLEWCGGGSLDDHIERTGGMPPRQAVTVLMALCEGLMLAHTLGIFHRDIKPDNVLLTEDGTPKLADFGIARVDLDGGPRKTATRMGMGSHGYMPPEQVVNASKVNAAYDIHALGMTLWHMVSGQAPYVEQLSLLRWYKRFQTDDTLMEAIPLPLVAVLRQATRLENAERYQTLEDFIQALQAILCDLPPDPPGTLPLKRMTVQSVPPVPVTREYGTPVPASRAPVTRPVEEGALLKIGTLHETNGHMSAPVSVVASDAGPTAPVSRFTKVLVSALVLSVLLLVGVGMTYVATLDHRPSEASASTVAVAVATPASLEPITPITQRPSAPVLVASALPSAAAPVSAPEPKKPTPPSAPPKVKDPVKREPLVTGIAAAPSISPVPPSEPPSVQNPYVKLTGDVPEVWLQGSTGKIRLPGRVPPGVYKVMARFEGRKPDEVLEVISRLDVALDSSFTIRCSSSYTGCKR